MQKRGETKNSQKGMLKRGLGLVAMLFCMAFSSYAQTPTIEADVDKACVGEAIVLTVTGYDNSVTAVNLWAKDGPSGTPYSLKKTATYSGGMATFVYEMVGHDIIFLAENQGNRVIRTPEGASVALNTDCPNSCHQSSSGEYINGTDFNITQTPLPLTTPVTRPYNTEIESYFDDYDVRFTVNSCGADPHITNDVSAYLGGKLPKDAEGNYSNYYWVSGADYQEINCAPFKFEFKMYGNSTSEPVWDTKYYRLAMKVYIIKKADCNNCANAQIKLETGAGSQGNFYENADHMEVIVFDDATGKQIGEPFLVNKSFDSQNIGNLLCKSEFDNKLIRLEIHFYGKFTMMNRHANEYFSLSPRFQQLGCMNMAVDYVSAEIMSVCMDKPAVCVGDYATVKASGFPYGSYYVWEENVHGNWIKMSGCACPNCGHTATTFPTDNGRTICPSCKNTNIYCYSGFNEGKDADAISEKVTTIGRRQFRVYDRNTIGSSSEYIYFQITGKNCDPVQPTSIKKNPVVCAPGTATFVVDPTDANEEVTYTWSMSDTNGHIYFSDKINYTYGDLSEASRGDTVTVDFSRDLPDGKYYITVQPVTREYLSDGSYIPHKAGQEIRDSFLLLKNASPALKLMCNDCDGLAESQKEICPTDKKQVITANATLDPTSPYYGNYVFEWLGAASATDPAGASATVVLPTDGVCDGTVRNHQVKVTVGVKLPELFGHTIMADTLFCPSSDANNYRLKPIELPTINCASLGSKKTYTLAPTESQKVITLPSFPEYTAGCESDPDMQVTLEFTPADGIAIKQTINSSQSKISADIAKNTFTLSAGTGTVTYSVLDGCGHSASCSIVIEVLDVTPPNIDCSELDKYNYTAHLKYQDGRCTALPGYYTDLPTLTEPKLTDKNGVDGTITGKYFGRLMSTSQPAYANEAQRAMFDKTVDLNANYKVGDTYILWAFEDKSHNFSYCLQKITVIDDLIPDVVCPDFSSVSNVDNQAGECGLSVNGLLAWLANNGYSVPSATDVCSGEGEEITAELYYNEKGKTPVLISVSSYNDIIFNVGTTYVLTWRFWKKNRVTYADCTLEFTVKDTEAPVFDCSSLGIVRVTSNVFKPLNQPAEYLDYASKNDVKVGTDTYTGTLADAFANGDIKFPSLSDVKDNCSGDVTITGSLEGPDETGTMRTLVITSTADLEKLKYGIGLTSVTYTFTDKEGNASQCTQNIVVTSGTTPKPNCDYSHDTLYVNGECLATLLMEKSEVPTALIPVNRTGMYFNFRRPIIAGLHFDEECTILDQYFPDKLYELSNTSNPGPAQKSLDPDAPQYYKDMMGNLVPGAADPGPGGTWIVKRLPKLTPENICALSADLSQLVMNDGIDHNDWFFYQKVTTGPAMPGPWGGGLGVTTYSAGITAPGSNRIFSVSNSLTQPKDTLGYPYKITLETLDGTVIKEVLNPYKADETVPTRIVVPRWYGGSGTDAHVCPNAEQDFALVCETEDVKIHNNFPDVVLNVTDLTKGEYMVKYHFQDKKGGAQIAYCYRQITVIDTISPKVECGDWNKEGTFKANDECRKPANEVSWFKKPTAEQLNAKDNCTTNYADFTITWKRVFKSVEDISDKALTDPFLMDTTYMYWYIADQSGNKTFCKQTIIVNDSTGPDFDCNILKPITAYADKDCKVDSSVMAKEGLVVPVAKDDACSPTGGDIKGVGTRSDGKPMSDPYELINSPITVTWTFSDAAGNTTVCEQVITILDTIQPVFDCNAIRDTFINLDAKQCVASKDMVEAVLGTHEAEDNCSGKVPGVPHVLMPDNTLADLFTEFKKDTAYTIVWTFTDDAGVVKECSQLLSINDTIPPSIKDKCPEDKVIPATEETSCELSFDNLDLPTPESLAVTDNCDGLIIPELVIRISKPAGKYVYVYGVEEAKKETYPVGDHIVYWIYSDKAKPTPNRDTCVQNISILDNIKPILSDCDDKYGKVYKFTVDEKDCKYDPAKVNEILVHPKAYDECESLVSGNVDENGNPLLSITPLIQRFKVDSVCLNDADEIVHCDSASAVIPLNRPTKTKFDTIMVADGVETMWYDSLFERGKHVIKWIFKDKSGNEVYCEKDIYIEDHSAPYFDCSTIDPDTLRPEAPVGKCEVEFDFLQSEYLKDLNYTAFDACEETPIPGVMYKDSTGRFRLQDDFSYTMNVGNVYKLWWVFKDVSGNYKSCPQFILPSHNNPITIDCTLWPDSIYVMADSAECTANNDSVLAAITIPSVMDACGLGTIYGEPYTDSISSKKISFLSDRFSTGYTDIYWRFVSPWNLHDTAWCRQVLVVGGNKGFDIDCATLTPDILDTITGCEPSTSAMAKIVAPKVADPCADPDSSYYWRVGEGTRSDSTATSPMRVFDDPYPLGHTYIQWVFTDFTGYVKDTCTQDVFVRTSEEIKMNCDSLNHDTIKAAYEVPDGECTVSYDKILDPDTLKYPEAFHPCLDTVKIRVYPRRANGKAWTDDYIVGVNLIEWIFIDDTHTTINDSVMCTQPVQVGDNNASLFECKNIPNKRVELTGDDCTIDAEALDFTKDVPKAYDACGIYAGEEVVPTWKRTSGKGMDDLFTVGKDTIIWTFHYNSIDDNIVCEQEIHVLDSKAPLFDCDLLKDTTMKSEPGLCYLNQKEIKNMLDSLKNTHYATDACEPSIKIQGEYDETVIPSALKVGDTITVHWVFQDTAINLSKKECDQMITVIGDKAPIIDCDTLAHDTIYIQGCDTTLSAQTIKSPVAFDACTNDSVLGKGERLDGGELYGIYPVGTTTIHWTFTSPFSTESTSCDQQITILTEKEIDFKCETLKDDTFNVEEGECSVLVTLPGHVGYHPCPEQSGVTTIIGIPSSNGKDFTANADSTEWSMTLPTGVWEIKWTFTDTSNTMAHPVKICSQNVMVGDVNEMPVDCKNYPDTLIVLPEGDCEITWNNIGFKAPTVVDLCSKEVIDPTITRWSGKTMEESFTVGLDTIYWSYSFAGQDIMCKQAIHVVDSIEPLFNCDNLKPLELVAQKGSCEVSSEEIDAILGDTFAVEACSNEKIWGKKYIGGVPVSNVTAHVGDTLKVDWIFKNDSLSAAEKHCEQYIYVYGNNQPVFDCASLKDTIFKLRPDQCSLPGTEFTLDIPMAADSCTHELVAGVPSRVDGKEMTDIFELGTTVVSWSFISPHSKDSSKVCPQNVIVKDITAPIFDCDTLFEDTIKVRVTENSLSETAVSYSEVLEAGFVYKSVMDLCDGPIAGVPTRVDGAPINADYSIGVTEIIWTFTDNSGNFDTCHQAILVEDYIVPELICPTNWNQKSVLCLDTFPVYNSFEEFAAAGGSFSAPNKLVPGSFRVTEDFTGKQFCDETHYRTYHVKDTRGNDITCTDTVYVRDNVAPSFSANVEPELVKTCSDEIPTMATVNIFDNCDPEPKLTSSEVSNRGADPTKCDYYTYDIIRTYTAVDRCENQNSMVQKVSIVDTIGPLFQRPDNWKDTVLASNLKSCEFGVPDLTVGMDKWVKDDCTDNTGIKITQNPVQGTHLTTTTVVWIRMEDLCNNRDSIAKVVRVQNPKTIVKIDAYTHDTCVSNDNPFSIASQLARHAEGRVEIVRPNGVVQNVSSQFSYDYYKGERADISDENLIFTDNPVTHRDMIEYYRANGGIDYFRSVMTLRNRRSQSGYYTYVAMDTITGCSDTASAYLKFNEVPRIALSSGYESVCELTLLDSTTFDLYLECVNDMGREIISQGWLNNDTIFNIFADTIYMEHNNTSMVYYATNSCGTATSLNSLLEFCGGALPSKSDSLIFVGNDLDSYNKMVNDSYVKRDSILLDVHKRYDPSMIKLSSEPHDPARIWLGEIVELSAHTDYQYQDIRWYRVVGRYDGDPVDELTMSLDSIDESDYLLAVGGYGEVLSLVDAPEDTTRYYVTISDGVCPSVASDLLQVNVILKLPTAFTPYERDGFNDIFMERHSIVIFDRYGQKVFEGSNGWDGTKGGKMADPGVYFYMVVMTDGSIRKGTIEVVFLND